MLRPPCNQRGIVLWIVLVFIFLISACMMEEILFVSKKILFNYRHFQQDASYVKVEQVMITLARQPIKNSHFCFVPRLSTKNLIQLPLNFWETHACSWQAEIKGYYLIEQLEQDDCAMLDDSSVAQYYRINFLLLDAQKKPERIFQSTFIQPVNAQNACSNQAHFVHPGYQMMRFL